MIRSVYGSGDRGTEDEVSYRERSGPVVGGERRGYFSQCMCL